MQLEANPLEAEGLQKIECAVAEIERQRACMTSLKGPKLKLELSVSVGPPLPKRYMWVATAMVSSLTSPRVCKAVVPKPRGRCVSAGGTFSVHLHNLRRKQYQLRWSPCESMWAILNEFTAVVLREVQRDLQPPKQPYGSHGFQAHLGKILSCHSIVPTLF